MESDTTALDSDTTAIVRLNEEDTMVIVTVNGEKENNEENNEYNEEAQKRDDKRYYEEAEEREEFRIEQLLEANEDEAPIRHDVVSDSDSDEEEDDEVRERAQEIARTYISRGDGSLYKKQKFINGVAFKETVVDYVVRTGRNLWQYRYDKLKLGFKCAGGGEKDTTRKHSICDAWL
ncbi:hypothetical protein AALP_AA8G301100 [Arabis alpina]|uniref:Transposase MuDR plant domain-containing protein n=1 Tax=Arabis alpina TaxID=50452 RepID=A0A087GAE5_ARAAL|nr:hypothetical protein AALP_AA8G301100 [Arabis alpina]